VNEISLRIAVLLFALACAVLLYAVHRAARRAQFVDSHTALPNYDGLRERGDALLETCRRAGKPLAVAVFDCADVLEVRAIYGNDVARQLTRRVVRRLSASVTPGGFAARTGPAEFALVLPGLGRAQALAHIQRVLGKTAQFELDMGGNEIVIAPDYLVESGSSDLASVVELHEELRREISRRQAAEQDRHHRMQRERERHSRPMGLAPMPA
jgi:GGDEF domain-containing protein